MLLAIDMGNTNIVIGCIDDERIYFEERLSTDESKTELEYAMGFKTVLDLHGIDGSKIEGAIISSVVPNLVNIVKEAVIKIVGKEPLVVGPGVKTGLNIFMDNPKQVGGDRVVNAVAGLQEYGAPLIIVDMGTATTCCVVDKDQNYIGGIIMPGVNVALEALVARTAQLPRITLEAPKKVIGKNTIDCMKSGTIFANAAAIDGLIERMEEELGYQTTVLATGGLAKVIVPYCKKKIILDDELLLKGLKIIYDKNMEN
ncbi:MAG: type III pantothenate kinase [Lachnospiraceae bacterium]|nr:type III pantothenate kinase [Lachnospiraceae bacterium]